MAKHRKSIGRRRSRSLVGFASKDLCETIPKALSPSERLLMLLESSFQYSLSVIQRDMMMDKDFDISKFRKHGTDCWEKIRTMLKEKNLCESAVTKDLDNVSILDIKVGECDEDIAVLEKETAQWDSIISHYKESLDKEMHSPCTVDSSKWKSSDQLHDYSSIIQDTTLMHEGLYKQVAKLKSSETTISAFLKHSRKNYRSYMKLRSDDYAPYKVMETPRTLIKKMNHANKNIKQYQYS